MSISFIPAIEIKEKLHGRNVIINDDFHTTANRGELLESTSHLLPGETTKNPIRVIGDNINSMRGNEGRKLYVTDARTENGQPVSNVSGWVAAKHVMVPTA